MDDQEKREAYLTARGWSRISVYFWKRDGKTGSHNIDSAVDQQMYQDADVAIDAMLRLPALLDKIRAAWKMWTTPAWCDPEMGAAMDALAAEVTE